MPSSFPLCLGIFASCPSSPGPDSCHFTGICILRSLPFSFLAPCFTLRDLHHCLCLSTCVIPAVLPLFTALGHRSAVRGWEALNIIHLRSPLNNTSPVVSACLSCNGKQHHLSGREEKHCCYADRRRAITAKTYYVPLLFPVLSQACSAETKGKLDYILYSQTHWTVFLLACEVVALLLFKGIAKQQQMYNNITVFLYLIFNTVCLDSEVTPIN